MKAPRLCQPAAGYRESAAASWLPKAAGEIRVFVHGCGCFSADDIGRAVVYIASLPLDTNVLFMTVMANLMPFVGRG
jgi:NADP-dependent 3-hydroxy acid dehydrogenase YdfG